VASPIALAGAGSAPTDPNHAPAVLATPLLPLDRLAPRVISQQNCWLMDDMMADVIKRGTGVRAGEALHRDDIAGKTGTTNDARDTWFNGFNSHLVASVWVGFDDQSPLGANEQGGVTAVPIWIDFMREALRGQADSPRPLPPGLVTVRISRRTGMLAAPSDTDTMYETFMDGTLPQAPSPGALAPGAAPANPAAGGAAPLF
jgi:penicillin-binding protein 1A